ncbi:hypothetical protein [Primorskyibacter flagellatus]|uniref:Secreted protein n=1 Tax=Primorskyibacter flagellatus TaxID=1387277 RepID=A0A1W2DV63_9RHOB|nr:hypothetical protein [Primorskyibacter flagellatus]SMD00928.1 hypothetical protein SAMN06295998_1188 [Primorskyibacter flagellatus]
MRFFITSCVAMLLTASASAAATVVAEYDTFASISVSVVSATYEHSGTDAPGALRGDIIDYDFAIDRSGTGIIDFKRDEFPWEGTIDPQGWPRYSVALAASGYASPTEISGSSYLAGGINPGIFYRASSICHQHPVGDCPAVERLVLELSYDVETRASPEVHDPLTGSASAAASADLRVGGDALQIGARGNSNVSGTHRFVMEPDTWLHLSLFIPGVGGSATYQPPQVVPLPPAIPLMGSGLLMLGLVSRRRSRLSVATED